MFKLTNPLHYPIAVMVGGIVLVVGVRLIRLPNLLILPTSIVITTVTAGFLKGGEPDELRISQQQLQRELQLLKEEANKLITRAELLREEAGRLLTNNMELLVSVQDTCDHITEIPDKIDELGRKITGSNSLLSLSELQIQLQEVEKKLVGSSGVAKEQLQQLKDNITRNIQLSKSGENARQAQILNLQNLVQASAGVLQELQNKLRTSDLKNSQEIQEVKKLSEQLESYQDNFNILL